MTKSWSVTEDKILHGSHFFFLLIQIRFQGSHCLKYQSQRLTECWGNALGLNLFSFNLVHFAILMQWLAVIVVLIVPASCHTGGRTRRNRNHFKLRWNYSGWLLIASSVTQLTLWLTETGLPVFFADLYKAKCLPLFLPLPSQPLGKPNISTFLLIEA